MLKDTLKNQVTKRLISLIAGGECGIGEALPAERKLSERFGVSRGTLRKAIGELAELGLVEVRGGSGAYVRCSNFADMPQELLPDGVKRVSIDDIMIARKAIELAAVEEAIANINELQIEKLRRIVCDMVENSENLPLFVSLDMGFHRYIIECTANPVLLAAYDAIEEYHKYLQVVTTQNEQCQELTLAYHKRITESIVAGDVASTKKILNEHLENVLEQLK